MYVQIETWSIYLPEWLLYVMAVPAVILAIWGYLLLGKLVAKSWSFFEPALEWVLPDDGFLGDDEDPFCLRVKTPEQKKREAEQNKKIGLALWPIVMVACIGLFMFFLAARTLAFVFYNAYRIAFWPVRNFGKGG